MTGIGMAGTGVSDALATQEISYAYSARSRGGRAVIRLIENTTGRIGLIRRADGYQHEVARGRSFWEVIAERYDLSLDVVGGSVSHVPANGPLVLIANHPFGILDGLMMGLLLDRVRGNFRILAHNVFRRAPELDKVILPISFESSKEAMKLNLDTRAAALRYLGGGGAVGVFPGGTVSTAARPFGQPMDPGWRNFTAKMIARSGATVVPVFFEGHNSRLFQLLSHVHPTLRVALLIKEFRRRIGGSVRLVVGEPLSSTRLEPLRSEPGRLMDFLRRSTYELSPVPVRSYDYGYEFDGNYRI